MSVARYLCDSWVSCDDEYRDSRSGAALWPWLQYFQSSNGNTVMGSLNESALCCVFKTSAVGGSDRPGFVTSLSRSESHFNRRAGARPSSNNYTRTHHFHSRCHRGYRCGCIVCIPVWEKVWRHFTTYFHSTVLLCLSLTYFLYDTHFWRFIISY